ncbi:hypothetical protein AWU65_03785 [Paenibacillus glucanolyticus]|jgi:hypothetical protein|uniref:Uncharacterized protein n=1 Tax=Paenibacillus glucanolyticus TaxID=59843 RepID=A0A163GRI1_9BACL|nr:hypothetical protein [Paenibacillus glucanolyticus]KZS45112.1 hypothetical protein AWU65_03785 [Paenibacillus glucanolyticus]OMF63858.1 hypothetical protein BK142_32465 [Paenibacillus glucanolyticus]
MNTYKYPISLTGVVFYWEQDQYYELFENRTRQVMSREVFEFRSEQYNAAGSRFIIIDDKQISLLLQVWDQQPLRIDTDRLHFYYDFGIITKNIFDHYMTLKTQP